jgi:hypothetical protein
MFKRIFQSWLTTSFGLVTLVPMIPSVIHDIVSRDFTHLPVSIGLLAPGLGLVFAKDASRKSE